MTKCPSGGERGRGHIQGCVTSKMSAFPPREHCWGNGRQDKAGSSSFSQQYGTIHKGRDQASIEEVRRSTPGLGPGLCRCGHRKMWLPGYRKGARGEESVGPCQATWGSRKAGQDSWSTPYQPHDLLQLPHLLGPRTHPHRCHTGPVHAACSELSSPCSQLPLCGPSPGSGSTYSPNLQPPNPWPNPSFPFATHCPASSQFSGFAHSTSCPGYD